MRLRARLVRLAVSVATGCAFVLTTAVGVAAQVDPTSTSTTESTTTTSQPTTTTTQPTTTTTTQPTTTTTQPTTTTTRPTTTTTRATTTSSTTSTTQATTTTESDDDGGSNTGTWVLIGLLGLVALAAAAWLIASMLKRRAAADQWDTRRMALLDEAQQAHDGTVDLLARWSTLTTDQLPQRWGHEMESLERLRSHLSRLTASGPEGPARQALDDVAGAVDDLRIALGQTDLGATQAAETAQMAYPPPAAAGAAADLQAAIHQAGEPRGRGR